MQSQTKTLIKITTSEITLFLSLLIVVTILPQFVRNQFFTGPIVNAVLFIATVTLGTTPAILIGLAPSTVALASGLLPVVLAPMIPFIMISNAILVATFSLLKRNNYVGAAVVACLVKYLFLYISVYWVTHLIVQKPIAVKAAAVMMQWPQLVTALCGAAITFGILKKLNKI